MTRLLPILLAMLIISPTPMVDTATQDDYRVEVLQVQVQRLQSIRDWASRNGVIVDADGGIFCVK